MFTKEGGSGEWKCVYDNTIESIESVTEIYLDTNFDFDIAKKDLFVTVYFTTGDTTFDNIQMIDMGVWDSLSGVYSVFYYPGTINGIANTKTLFHARWEKTEKDNIYIGGTIKGSNQSMIGATSDRVLENYPMVAVNPQPELLNSIRIRFTKEISLASIKIQIYVR